MFELGAGRCIGSFSTPRNLSQSLLGFFFFNQQVWLTWNKMHFKWMCKDRLWKNFHKFYMHPKITLWWFDRPPENLTSCSIMYKVWFIWSRSGLCWIQSLSLEHCRGECTLAGMTIYPSALRTHISMENVTHPPTTWNWRTWRTWTCETPDRHEHRNQLGTPGAVMWWHE